MMLGWGVPGCSIHMPEIVVLFYPRRYIVKRAEEATFRSEKQDAWLQIKDWPDEG